MIKDLYHIIFLLTYRHTGRKRIYMSEKIWKVIDTVFAYGLIATTLIYAIILKISPNSVNVGLSSAISFCFAIHLLREQLSHKHTHDMQQKEEC